MDPSGREDQLGSNLEVVGKISESLLTLFRTLCSTNSDISIYHLHHAVEHIRRDPYTWGKLDETYTMYEEQANNCRRLWMKLRATAEKEMARADTAAGTASAPVPHFRGRSPSPLEYQSDHGGDEPAKAEKVDRVTPMDIDPQGDDQRPPVLAVDPPPPKPKRKRNDASTSQRVIVTPSGPTSCRLAPIPKGVKLSVETTRNPAPQDSFVFKIPQKLVASASERKPLNRTKRNQANVDSSQNSFSSLQQTGPSTAPTSAPASPKRNYSSAREYWEPRRPIRPNEFQMDEDRLFGSLDCLGPPFHVNMEEITHNTIPATWADVVAVYGGKLGLLPKISADKLRVHGFDHWLTPNIEYYPSLPARPGWPGIMLRLGDGAEEWRPEKGTEFRVVTRKAEKYFEYLGQYEMINLGDITGDEWKEQSAKVKKRWTYVIGGGHSWHALIAAIALKKKLGREASSQEFGKYTGGLCSENYIALARDHADDIDQAFCEEEEVITVWGMKCVGYDYGFERHLARSLKKAGDKGKGKGDEPESRDSPPSKRQRVAKGKAKDIKFDWSGAKYHDDSRDEDYKPAQA